ncbi:MAG: hypothetical protein LBT81_03745 [Helicobacteraceae bacterium]|nr:hypothetical protein [Helicobacteraceae bacterium]
MTKAAAFVNAYDGVFLLAKTTYGRISENAIWYFLEKYKLLRPLCETPELLEKRVRKRLEKHGIVDYALQAFGVTALERGRTTE